MGTIFTKFLAAVRTSEFWGAVFVAAGQSLVAAGVIPQLIWDNFVWPVLAYVILRITGKVAKAVIPTPAAPIKPSE